MIHLLRFTICALQGLPKIFSAGLDILEMYQPKPERLAEFWRTLQNMWMRLYGSRLVTIAAIAVSNRLVYILSTAEPHNCTPGQPSHHHTVCCHSNHCTTI